MAAIGPDFKAGFVDPAPVSNADCANTLARLLGLELTPRGQPARPGDDRGPDGRRAGRPAAGVTIRSEPAANGFVTVLNAQEAARQTYFDAAGAPGRTLGLNP